MTKRFSVPDGVHLLKKYNNRKIYSVELSHYVTLSDIRNLIQEGESILVLDNSNGQDITNLVLLNIIMENESVVVNNLENQNIYENMVRNNITIGSK